MRLVLALHDIGKYIPKTPQAQHQATAIVLPIIRPCLPISDQEFRVMNGLICGDPIGKASILLTGRATNPSCPISRNLEELKIAWEAKRPIIRELRGKITEHGANAIAEINSMKNGTDLSLEDFSRLLAIYYQCDSSSYSLDAELLDGKRGHTALEFLYEIGRNLPNKAGEKLFIKDSGTGLLKPSAPFVGLFEFILNSDNLRDYYEHLN